MGFDMSVAWGSSMAYRIHLLRDMEADLRRLVDGLMEVGRLVVATPSRHGNLGDPRLGCEIASSLDRLQAFLDSDACIGVVRPEAPRCLDLDKNSRAIVLAHSLHPGALRIEELRACIQDSEAHAACTDRLLDLINASLDCLRSRLLDLRVALKQSA